MTREEFQLLRNAIKAGLVFEYPTVFGKTAQANPYDVVRRNGQIYLLFSKASGGKLERKLESCFAIAGTPGFAELRKAGMIQMVGSTAGKF
jgi:hypothetical protein